LAAEPFTGHERHETLETHEKDLFLCFVFFVF